MNSCLDINNVDYLKDVKGSFDIPQGARHITVTLDPAKYNYRTSPRKLHIKAMSAIKDILDDHCVEYNMILELTKQGIPHYHGYVQCINEVVYEMLFIKMKAIGRTQIDEIKSQDDFKKYCMKEIDKTYIKMNYVYKRRQLVAYKQLIAIAFSNKRTIDESSSIIDHLNNIEKMRTSAKQKIISLVKFLDKGTGITDSEDIFET